MYGVRTGGFTSVPECEAYFDGVADGLRVYAWHRDGTQYVGTTGSTLAEAQNELEAMRAIVCKKTKGDVAEVRAESDDDADGEAVTLGGPKKKKK